MKKVNIYIAVDSHYQKMSNKLYSYILEYNCRGEIKTKECFGSCYSTLHQAHLKAITEAVKCLKEKCEVEVFLTDGVLVGMFNSNFELWKRLDWQRSVGGDIANKNEWAELSEAIEGHKVKFINARHSYLAWQQEEFDKRNTEAKQMILDLNNNKSMEVNKNGTGN